VPTLRRIALLIRSLDYGGAEKQATVLANGLARSGHAVSLVAFYPGSALRSQVFSDVSVKCLEKRGRWDILGLLRNLLSVLNEEPPDVLYSFLPGPNVLACLTKLRFPKLKVVWGVRASYVDFTRYDRLTGFSYWLERRFSGCPDVIIANSESGRRYAVSQGFPDTDRFLVIPNGIDTELFRPDGTLREVIRGEWGVLSHETLVGIVGRLDPMKDHSTFLEAAAKLAQRAEGMRFVSVGTGTPDYAALLREQACRLGLEKRMIWAGVRGDLPAIYNALDLLVSSSSFGEGFSNVLGEAMACGVPCVATDVGDAREILGDSDAVAQPRHPQALAIRAMAILERARLDGKELRVRLRQRIEENFSVETLVRRTSAALEAVP